MRVLLQPKVQRERMVRLIDWSLISNFFIAMIAIVNPLGKGNYLTLRKPCYSLEAFQFVERCLKRFEVEFRAQSEVVELDFDPHHFKLYKGVDRSENMVELCPLGFGRRCC